MDKKLYKFAFVFVFFLSVLRKLVFSTSVADSSLTKEGDIIFGALFPVYRKDANGECKVFNKDALLWIKAFNFALNELQNNHNPALQNTTFGFHIQDTCAKSALEQALDLVHSNKINESRNSSSRRITVVLSSHYEEDSSTLLSLFKIPNMIFTDLNAGEFGSFPVEHRCNFESVKVSFYRAKALVGMMKHFGNSSKLLKLLIL